MESFHDLTAYIVVAQDTTPLQSARHPPASSSLQQVANSHTQLPHHLQPPQQPNFNAATPQSHPQQALPRQQQQPGTAQSSRPTSASQNRQSVPHRAAAAQARPSPYGSESEGDGTPQSSRQSSPQKAARQQQHAEANHTQEEQMPTPSVANVGSLFDPDARDRSGSLPCCVCSTTALSHLSQASDQSRQA